MSLLRSPHAQAVADQQAAQPPYRRHNPKKHIDKPFLILLIIITVVGIFAFLSAALGFVATDPRKFTAVATNQTIGFLLGWCAFFVVSKIPYEKLKSWAGLLLIGAFIINLMVFIPGLHLVHGGASRWIEIGPLTFQPSELLKLTFIIYFAGLLSVIKDRLQRPAYSLVPYGILTGLAALLMLLQRDTDTLAVIAITGLALLFVAGARLRDIGIICLVGCIGLATVVSFRPYVLDRFATFINPEKDLKGSGYQINQTRIAIGSGSIFGKGLGQSTQKFGFVPEPAGDSVFAIIAEETGFVGASVLILLYITLVARIIRIATVTSNPFGGLLAYGIGILIVVESFMNISSMVGIIPLSGMPLLFISHGGTALMVSLIAAGLVANISRSRS
jgi:cell division protein FtsW